MSPTLDSIRESVELVEDETKKAEVSQMCLVLLDVLRHNDETGRTAEDTECDLLEDLLPDVLTHQLLYGDVSFWRVMKSTLLFVSPQSKKLLENPPQVLKQSRTAAIVGHAISNRRVTLDLAGPQEVAKYEELQTAAENLCMTQFSVVGAASSTSSSFRAPRRHEKSRSMRSARRRPLTRTPKSKRELDQRQRHEEEAAVDDEAADSRNVAMDENIEDGDDSEVVDVAMVGNVFKVKNVPEESGATAASDADDDMPWGSSDEPAEQIDTAHVDIVCAGEQAACPAARDADTARPAPRYRSPDITFVSRHSRRSHRLLSRLPRNVKSPPWWRHQLCRRFGACSPRPPDREQEQHHLACAALARRGRCQFFFPHDERAAHLVAVAAASRTCSTNYSDCGTLPRGLWNCRKYRYIVGLKSQAGIAGLPLMASDLPSQSQSFRLTSLRDVFELALEPQNIKLHFLQKPTKMPMQLPNLDYPSQSMSIAMAMRSEIHEVPTLPQTAEEMSKPMNYGLSSQPPIDYE